MAELLNLRLAFRALSDEDPIDEGVPLDDKDDEDLEDDEEEGVEKDGVIGPEDPYKDEEEKTDE